MLLLLSFFAVAECAKSSNFLFSPADNDDLYTALYIPPGGVDCNGATCNGQLKWKGRESSLSFDGYSLVAGSVTASTSSTGLCLVVRQSDTSVVQVRKEKERVLSCRGLKSKIRKNNIRKWINILAVFLPFDYSSSSMEYIRPPFPRWTAPASTGSCACARRSPSNAPPTPPPAPRPPPYSSSTGLGLRHRLANKRRTTAGRGGSGMTSPR